MSKKDRGTFAELSDQIISGEREAPTSQTLARVTLSVANPQQEDRLRTLVKATKMFAEALGVDCEVYYESTVKPVSR